MASGIHIIIGADEFLVSETAKKFCGDGSDLEVIDALEATNAELQLASLALARDSFRTPPFLEPAKTTWWKNVNFLPGAGGTKRSAGEEVKEALEDFARELASTELPDNQCFVLTASGLLKTSVFAKTIAKNCEVIVFEKAKKADGQREASVRAMDFASELGLTFAAGVVEHFVACTGLDARNARSELTKLRDFLGKRREITHKDIEAISSPAPDSEPMSWAVTDAITERNLAKTLAALTPLKGENGYAVWMSQTIANHFRVLAELKDAAKRHCEGEVAGVMPWKMSAMLRQLQRWSLGELRSAHHRFLELRFRAVRGQLAADEMLEIELARACCSVSVK